MWMEKRGTKKFLYREYYEDPYTDERKTVSVTLTSSSHQAKKQAQKILNNKIDQALKTKKMSDHTIQELLDEWWTYKKPTVRNNTIRIYESIMRLMAKNENINLDAKIAKVDAQYFQKFFNTLSFSHKQNLKYRSVLKMAFDYAVDMSYLKDNPVEKAKVPKPVETIEDYVKVEDLYLEKEEVYRLLDCYRSAHQSVRVGDLIEVMYLTGMRIGEAISLTGANYHKKQAVLDIHGTLDYSKGYKNAKKSLPKTKASYREIGISNRVIEILDRVILENQLRFDDYSKDDFIFVGKTGKPLQANTISQSLHYNNEKLGKNKINKRLHSHIFRHSHISLLSELNVPIKAIMQRVGHQDEATTLKIYTHVTQKQKADIVDKLNNLGL